MSPSAAHSTIPEGNVRKFNPLQATVNEKFKLLKEALTQWGYQVACVGTGNEALEAVRTELFDAAITDIRMP